MKREFSFLPIIRVFILTTGLLLLAHEARLLDFRQIALPIFMIVVALVRMADVELPQGDRVALDAAVVVACLLLFDLPSAMIISAGGLIVATVGKQQTDKLGSLLLPVAERAIIVFVSSLWIGGRYLTAPETAGSLNLLSWDLVRAIFMAITFFSLEIALDQLELSRKHAAPFIPTFLGSIRFIGPIYFSLGSIGILMSMMYPSMGMWGVFLFGLPLVVIHYSFKLFLDVKNTYRHTTSALARAIQVEDFDQRSHSERVADLAVDIGKELGFHGEKLESMGYAALLHDIGKLGLDVDSFDALLDSRRMNMDVAPHAEIGAEILEQVDFLKDFADIVRKHHQPYEHHRNVDLVHPIEARIIAIANYFDQLTNTPLAERRLSVNQAVARIKREASQFDPKTLRALIRVLKRQQRLIVTT